MTLCWHILWWWIPPVTAARSTRVLWSDLLWISLLSLLVSFWLPAVNQIITNLKTTNYDSLVENKRTDKSLYFPRKFINPFSWSRFACTNCQIFMTSKILMLNNTYGSDRHWSAQQNRSENLYSFYWKNSPWRPLSKADTKVTRCSDIYN